MRWASETRRNNPTIAIERPGTARRDDFQGRLSVAVKEFVPQATGGILVGEFDGDGADPLHVYDRHQGVGQHALDRCAFRQILKRGHKLRFPRLGYWWAPAM